MKAVRSDKQMWVYKESALKLPESPILHEQEHFAALSKLLRLGINALASAERIHPLIPAQSLDHIGSYLLQPLKLHCCCWLLLFSSALAKKKPSIDPAAGRAVAESAAVAAGELPFEHSRLPRSLILC